MRLTWPSDADASSEKSIEPHRSLHSDSDSELGVSALALQEAQCDRLLRGWDKAWYGSADHTPLHAACEAFEQLYGRAPGTQDPVFYEFERPSWRPTSMTPMASGMLGATTSPGGSVYSAQHPGRSHNSSTLLADSQQPNAAPADLFAMRRMPSLEHGTWRERLFYPLNHDDEDPGQVVASFDEHGHLSASVSMRTPTCTPNLAHAAEQHRNSTAGVAGAAHGAAGEGTNGAAAANGKTKTAGTSKRGGPTANAGAAPAAANGGKAVVRQTSLGGLSRLRSTGGNTDSGRELETEEKVKSAAWRWRFARRWQAELQRAPEPNDGPTDTVSRILNGYGEGLHLQVDSRTRAAAQDALTTSESLIFDSHSLAGETLSRDGSKRATSDLAAIVEQAHVLRQQQSRLEELSSEEWRKCGKDPWVGTHIKAVVIDNTGTFNYALFKLSDVHSHHQYIVRGSSRVTPSQLSDNFSTEVSTVCFQFKSRPAGIQILGCGRMAWRLDKDRHLTILGDATQVYDTRYQVQEFLGLTAAITKQGLPSSYEVTVQ